MDLCPLGMLSSDDVCMQTMRGILYCSQSSGLPKWRRCKSDVGCKNYSFHHVIINRALKGEFGITELQGKNWDNGITPCLKLG